MDQILSTIDANAIIACIVTAFIIPVITSCGKYITSFLKAKMDSVQKSTDNQIIKDLKIDLLRMINEAVVATNQTFVNSLKDKNQFTEKEWAEAFNKTKTAVLESLTENQIEILNKNVGNLDKYIETLIQSAVDKNKKPKTVTTEETPIAPVVVNVNSGEVTEVKKID